MSKATYYIEVDTYWQNSPSFFVGPFASKEDATAYVNQDSDNVWLSTSQCGGDIRSAWRVYVKPLSKTEARAHGMRRYEDRDEQDNAISPRTRLTARALSAATQTERDF